VHENKARHLEDGPQPDSMNRHCYLGSPISDQARSLHTPKRIDEGEACGSDKCANHCVVSDNVDFAGQGVIVCKIQFLYFAQNFGISSTILSL
jgi:hypothetical protein